MLNSTTFDTIQDVMLHRRTTKLNQMNGQKIPDEQIHQLLALADCAPTHARTEPWRFIVYCEKGLEDFCKIHADLYWNNTPEETRTEARRDALTNQYKNISHLIIVWMHRAPTVKIPWLEEYAATAAAIQNMLIGATALGISSMWNTGGMVLKPALKSYLGLEEEDAVLGFIYLGYSDEAPSVAVRNTPIFEKAQFIK